MSQGFDQQKFTSPLFGEQHDAQHGEFERALRESANSRQSLAEPEQPRSPATGDVYPPLFSNKSQRQQHAVPDPRASSDRAAERVYPPNIIQTQHDIFADYDRAQADGQMGAARLSTQPPPLPQAAKSDEKYENSVLFSLANLQALALSSAQPERALGTAKSHSTQETSGLIDIRLISSALTSARSSDVEDLISITTHSTFPERLPAPATRMSLGTKLGITAGAIVLGAILTAVVMFTLADQAKNEAVSDRLALLQEEIVRLERERTNVSPNLESLQQVAAAVQQAAQAGDVAAPEQPSATIGQPGSASAGQDQAPIAAEEASADEDPAVSAPTSDAVSSSKKTRAAPRSRRVARKAAQSKSGSPTSARPAPDDASETPPSSKIVLSSVLRTTTPDPSPAEPAPSSSGGDVADNLFASTSPSPSPSPSTSSADKRPRDELDALLGDSLSTPAPKQRKNKAAAPAPTPNPAAPAPTPAPALTTAPAPTPTPGMNPGGLAPSAPSSSNPPRNAPLSRSDVQKGMNAVAGRVKGCAMGQVGTIVTMQVAISKNGNVLSAIPLGSFAGTPIGECAARVVRTARFPQSGDDLTVSYPFKL